MQDKLERVLTYLQSTKRGTGLATNSSSVANLNIPAEMSGLHLSVLFF